MLYTDGDIDGRTLSIDVIGRLPRKAGFMKAALDVSIPYIIEEFPIKPPIDGNMLNMDVGRDDIEGSVDMGLGLGRLEVGFVCLDAGRGGLGSARVVLVDVVTAVLVAAVQVIGVTIRPLGRVVIERDLGSTGGDIFGSLAFVWFLVITDIDSDVLCVSVVPFLGTVPKFFVITGGDEGVFGRSTVTILLMVAGE